MTTAIGGSNLLYLLGPAFEPMGMETEIITRRNVSGIAVREVGLRPGDNAMESCADAADAADVASLVSAYKALEGTLVTVVDDHGITSTNVLVRKVQVTRRQKIVPASGGVRTTGDFTYLVFASWQLVVTETI